MYVLCKAAHAAYDECEARKVFDTKVSIVLFNAFSCDQPNTRLVCHKMRGVPTPLSTDCPVHKCDRCPCAAAENSQSQIQSKPKRGKTRQAEASVLCAKCVTVTLDDLEQRLQTACRYNGLRWWACWTMHTLDKRVVRYGENGRDGY